MSSCQEFKAAYKVRDVTDEWRGDAVLYKLLPPIVVGGEIFDHAVVSRIITRIGSKETGMFAADSTGEFLDGNTEICIADEHVDHEHMLGLKGYSLVNE